MSRPAIRPPPLALTLPEVRAELSKIAEALEDGAESGYAYSASQLASELAVRIRGLVDRATDTERAPPAEDAP